MFGCYGKRMDHALQGKKRNCRDFTSLFMKLLRRGPDEQIWVRAASRKLADGPGSLATLANGSFAAGAETSGGDSFVAVMDPAEIGKLRDPFRDKLIEIAKGQGVEVAAPAYADTRKSWLLHEQLAKRRSDARGKVLLQISALEVNSEHSEIGSDVQASGPIHRPELGSDFTEELPRILRR